MHDLPIHPSRRSHVRGCAFCCHFQPTVNRNASKVEFAKQGGAAPLYEAEFICAYAIHWLARAFSVRTALSLTPHEPLNMLMQINNRPEGASRWRKGPSSAKFRTCGFKPAKSFAAKA